MTPLIFLAPLAVEVFSDMVAEKIETQRREREENEKIERILARVDKRIKRERLATMPHAPTDGGFPSPSRKTKIISWIVIAVVLFLVSVY